MTAARKGDFRDTGRLSGALSDEEYMRALRKKLAGGRVPYTGTIEITHRCNLRCVHCYLGDQGGIARSRRRELSTKAWLRVLDEAAAAGCMEMLITGGEPLLRRDFPDVYRHAKEAGYVVTVFTNATLVTDRIVDLFSDLPPFLVEASLYGATAPTHDAVTQARGSFARALKGVERLLDEGVNVGLKTIVMTVNRHEYRDMEELARSLGATWRLDSAICPCLPNADSGGLPNRCTTAETSPLVRGAAEAGAPMELRVAPQDAVACEMASAERVSSLARAYEQMKDRPVSGKLYTCGAGLTGFHVDPYGWLQPCLMTPGYRRSLLETDFVSAWKAVGRIRDVDAPPGFPCNTCDMQPICSGCPALFDLENGSPGRVSEYVCALTQKRFRSIQREGTCA